MPDSIIIYRNPFEKMFWENNGPIYLILFLVVFFAVFSGSYWIHKRCQTKTWKDPNPAFSIILGIVVSFVSVFYLAHFLN